MNEGFPAAPRARRDEEAPKEKVRLDLPGSLGILPPDRERTFEELMWAGAGGVIPWVGDGYRLGLNGLFKFTSADLNSRIDEYLWMPADAEGRVETGERLREELRAVWDERFDDINLDIRKWDPDRRD